MAQWLNRSPSYGDLLNDDGEESADTAQTSHADLQRASALLLVWALLVTAAVSPRSLQKQSSNGAEAPNVLSVFCKTCSMTSTSLSAWGCQHSF